MSKAEKALAVLVWEDEVVNAMLRVDDSMGLDQALDALAALSRSDHKLHDRIFKIRRMIARERGYRCCRCSGWNGVEYCPTYRRFLSKDYCRDCWLDLEDEMR